MARLQFKVMTLDAMEDEGLVSNTAGPKQNKLGALMWRSF